MKNTIRQGNILTKKTKTERNHRQQLIVTVDNPKDNICLQYLKSETSNLVLQDEIEKREFKICPLKFLYFFKLFPYHSFPICERFFEVHFFDKSWNASLSCFILIFFSAYIDGSQAVPVSMVP